MLHDAEHTALDESPQGIVFGEPALTPDGIETIARCAREACRKPFVPKSAQHRFCCAKCLVIDKESRPARVAQRSVNSHNSHVHNVSYRVARKALRRAGIDPDTLPELAVLRGRGVVPNWREEIGLPSRVPARQAKPVVAPSAPASAPPPFDAWALPSPTAEHTAHALTVTFSPAVAIDLTGTRFLHAAIAHAVAAHAQTEPHSPTRARWSLAPSGSGWVVAFADRNIADRMRGHVRDSRFGAAPKVLAFGNAVVRMRAPRVLAPGRYRVTLTTVTPVSWASNGHREVTLTPTPQTIIASVGRIATLLGVDVPEAHRAVARVESDVRRTKVFLGGHWQRGSSVAGLVRAIEGTVTVECNAVVAWLLACGEVLGLGGSTSVGLGRVRVTTEAL